MADTKSLDETQAPSIIEVLAECLSWTYSGKHLHEIITADSRRRYVFGAERIVAALEAAGYRIVPVCPEHGWQIVEEATAAVRNRTGHNGGTGSLLFRQELAALIEVAR